MVVALSLRSGNHSARHQRRSEAAPTTNISGGRVDVAQLFNVRGYGTVITGGASGLGLAYAEIMVDCGARVTLMDKNAAALSGEVARLRSAGGDVRGEHVDVTDAAALDQAFERTATFYGGLDVVFANAGIDAGPGFMTTEGARNPDGALENVSLEHWNKVIAVNLTAVFTTLQATARVMKRFGNGGRIIVTSSNAAIINESIVGTPYMPAKAGVEHLVRHAALELAEYGITVNAIAPGAFQTNIAGGRLKIPADRQAFEKRSLQRRVPTTDEIKGLALFLASPASAYMTGASILIDGGTALGRLD